MFKYLIVLSFLFIVGCTPTIQDRDFEKEEVEYIRSHGVDPMFAPATKDDIFMGRKDGITVSLHKDTSTYINGVESQNWFAVVTNENDDPKCVAIVWRLMDFEIINDNPELVYIKGHEINHNFTQLKQKLWYLNNVLFALPPSGYIHDVFIRDPDPKTQCVFENDPENI